MVTGILKNSHLFHTVFKDIENSDGEYTVIALSHKAVRVRINGRKAWVAKVNVELV